MLIWRVGHGHGAQSNIAKHVMRVPARPRSAGPVCPQLSTGLRKMTTECVIYVTSPAEIFVRSYHACQQLRRACTLTQRCSVMEGGTRRFLCQSGHSVGHPPLQSFHSTENILLGSGCMQMRGYSMAVVKQGRRAYCADVAQPQAAVGPVTHRVAVHMHLVRPITYIYPQHTALAQTSSCAIARH